MAEEIQWDLVESRLKHSRLEGGLNMADRNQWGCLEGRLKHSRSEGRLSDRQLTTNSQSFLLLWIHLLDIYRVGVVM